MYNMYIHVRVAIQCFASLLELTVKVEVEVPPAVFNLIGAVHSRALIWDHGFDSHLAAFFPSLLRFLIQHFPCWPDIFIFDLTSFYNPL